MDLPQPSADAVSALAPTGTLRAAINLSNFLLVTGKNEIGNPTGVSPSMAAAIARNLGLSISYQTYPSPGAAADAVDAGEWDICLIAEDPKRAETIEDVYGRDVVPDRLATTRAATA